MAEGNKEGKSQPWNKPIKGRTAYYKKTSDRRNPAQGKIRKVFKSNKHIRQQTEI